MNNTTLTNQPTCEDSNCKQCSCSPSLNSLEKIMMAVEPKNDSSQLYNAEVLFYDFYFLKNFAC